MLFQFFARLMYAPVHRRDRTTFDRRRLLGRQTLDGRQHHGRTQFF